MSKRNLRLGLVGPIPPPNGGMAMQTQQLANFLPMEQIDVEQVATNPPYRPAFIGRIKVVRAFFRLIPYLVKIWTMSGRVDVVHMMANSGWSWQLFSAPVIWLGWLRRTPVIVNYRGGGAGPYLQSSFARIKPTLDKAACVVVPSGFLAEVFKSFGFSPKIIPNIVDLDRFKPGERNTSPKHFTLIVTRNLEAIYGLDTAIKAVNLVRSRIPEVRLQIAGVGPQQQELYDLVEELGMGGVVSFVGRLGPEEIVAFYQSANVMLNPSRVDNMPNSILEALACGVPVVSTNIGGVPFVVEHDVNALLVQPDKAEQMAAAILKLHGSDVLRQRFSDAGVLEARKYCWQNVKEHWTELYLALAMSGKTSRFGSAE